MIARLTGLQGLAIALFVALLSFSMIQTASAEKLYYSTLFRTAVEGYDVVAYFTDGKPVEGSKDHSVEWKGVDWYFANAEHKKMFEADPDKYAPQYGGYCADGVAYDTLTVNIDPNAWRILNGKLYLNVNADVLAKFNADFDGSVSRADTNWPGLFQEHAE